MRRPRRRLGTLGAHQFARPNSFMVAGTNARRTMVTSTIKATTIPTPISLVKVI